MMRSQRTIHKPVSCIGKGLHSGAQVSLKLIPAPVDHGIVFIKKTLGGRVQIKVDRSKAAATDLSTTLGENESTVQTVEHLLSALSGLRITNLIVELNAGELPIMDGSSQPFVTLIERAGILDQEAEQPLIKINRTVRVRDGEKWIAIQPDQELSVHCTIRYNHPLLDRQEFTYRDGEEDFVNQIASARTFGFLREVEALWRRGLARGGSIENAIVLGPESVLNKEGLRFPDEFVRHKILDLIGDLSLLGMPVIGKVEAFCPGHQLNAQLVEKILSSPSSWEIIGDSRPVSAVSGKPSRLSIPA